MRPRAANSYCTVVASGKEAGSLAEPPHGEPDATLCLLAETLAFTQPRTGAEVSVRATLPAWAALAGEATAPGLAPDHALDHDADP